MRIAAIALVLAAAGCASVDAAPAGPAPADAAASAAAFERIKGLAGSWRGDFGEADHMQKGAAQVSYRVTGNGSAVEEVLFGGTPHEMVTLYHRDGPRLLLTHYCAAGNQPTMVLVPGEDPAVLRFEFLRGTNMEPADGHMHEAVFDLREEGRLRATWTYWEDGKPGMAAVIDTRPAR